MLERGVEAVVRRVTSRSGRGRPPAARTTDPAPAGGVTVAITLAVGAGAAASRVALGFTVGRLTVALALPVGTSPPVGLRDFDGSPELLSCGNRE